MAGVVANGIAGRCALRHLVCNSCIGSVAARRMSFDLSYSTDDSRPMAPRAPRPGIKKKNNKNRTNKRSVLLPEVCTPKNMANILQVRAVDILKFMIRLGENPRAADEPLRQDLATLIAGEFGCKAIHAQERGYDKTPRVFPADMSAFPRRPPLVTVIGHIDHGKTTLLDSLRKSDVVATEAGRITQHIGAFVVQINDGDESSGSNTMTFMDTPGHEAFTSLRERGVRTTDIALLVVAADSGVQEQTIEAIRVAKASGVQMIVCITKIDKISDKDSDTDTRDLREQLFKHGVAVEGIRPDLIDGIPCIEISAKTGRGMDDLKAAILLQAELMDLRAPIDGEGEGFVLESRMEKGRGALATVLVTAGTICEGDWVIVGTLSGKIRHLLDHDYNALDEATPGILVQIIGLGEVPPPGSHLFCVSSKEEADKVIEHRKTKAVVASSKTDREATQQQAKDARVEAVTKLTTETGRANFSKAEIDAKVSEVQLVKDSKQSDLPSVSIIIKADVAGSLEGVQKALSVLPQDEVALRVVRTAVGPIIEGDLALAKLTGSYMVSFGMKTPGAMMEQARTQGVPVIENQVVYSIVESIRDKMSALLPPSVVTDVLGEAEVKEMFEVNKGTKLAMKVAGCVVTNGLLRRGVTAQILREGEVIYENKLETLRSFRAPVPEVKRGSDCGLSITGFNEFQPKDVIKCISTRSVPRKLGDKKRT